MRDAVTDYHFKCVDLTEYKMELKMHAKASLLQQIFQRAKEEMKKRTGVEVTDAALENLNAIEIPESYYQFLSGVAMRKSMKMIIREMQSDNIQIVDWRLANAKFVKEKTRDWIILVMVTGNYVDRRDAV